MNALISALDQFANEYNYDDRDLPREEQIRVRVKRFLFLVANRGQSLADGNEFERLSLLLQKAYEKFPDANEAVLLRLAMPLLPVLNDWIDNHNIPPVDIGIRLSMDTDNKVTPFLCNHNSGCDCGEHPQK